MTEPAAETLPEALNRLAAAMEEHHAVVTRSNANLTRIADIVERAALAVEGAETRPLPPPVFRLRWPRIRPCTGCARRRWCWRDMERTAIEGRFYGVESIPFWSPFCRKACAVRRAETDRLEARSVGR